jgi:glycosyltransferase involved in cell wall biosynthesis
LRPRARCIGSPRDPGGATIASQRTQAGVGAAARPDRHDGLTLVVPVYNESTAIPGAVERLRALRERVDFPMEVIFVDDGSTDGTEAVLGELKTGAPGELRSIAHRRNRGYGAAIKTGVRAARYDTIAITDADDTYPSDRIPDMYRAMRATNDDMVVGARVGPQVRIPLLRRPAKWLLTRLARFLSGERIPDINSGLRVMTRELVERFWRILPDGFSFTTTITLAALTNGYRVAFTPIDYFRRKGRSKIRPIRDTLRFTQLIIRTCLYFNPLKVLVPLSVFLALAALGTLAASYHWLGQAMDVTFGLLLGASVMVMVFGLLADLINKRMP